MQIPAETLSVEEQKTLESQISSGDNGAGAGAGAGAGGDVEMPAANQEKPVGGAAGGPQRRPLPPRHLRRPPWAGPRMGIHPMAMRYRKKRHFTGDCKGNWIGVHWIQSPFVGDSICFNLPFVWMCSETSDVRIWR